MAKMLYGNFDQANNSGSSNFTDFNADVHIIKEELKKTWFLFRTSNGSVVKPYATYDENGEPSAPRNEHEVALMQSASPVESNNEQGDRKYVRPHYEVLSDAFSLVRLATFTGLSGKLAFVDWCSDMMSYCPPGVEAIQTPYHYLIRGLKSLLPDKNGKIKAGNGFTPSNLRKIQMKVNYSSPSILFRGAVLRHNGKPSSAKSAVDGVLFKTLFYVPHASASRALCLKMAGKTNPRMAVGPQNSPVADLFEIDGVNLSFNKLGADITADYGCELDYDQGYVRAAMTAFGLTDPSQYHQAVRAMFGPYQDINSMLNIMTVEQMVNLLKQHYPMSWLWWGLKDSPYATLFTPAEKEQAFADPEMASFFGINQPFANAFQQPAQSYQPQQQYKAASAPVEPPAMTNAYVSYVVQSPQPTQPQAPAYNMPGVGGGYGAVPPTYGESEEDYQIAPQAPAAPAPTQAPTQADSVASAIEARMSKWNQTFSAPAEDGIKY